MKKFIALVTVAVLATGIAGAQSISERKSGFQAETSLVLAGAEHWAVGARQSFLYCLNPDWSMGIGAGFLSNMNPDGSDVNMVPLYATCRWYWKDRRWSPFLDMSAGYAFATSDDAGGGAYVSPMIGINYHITGRLSLDMGIGYLYQGSTYMGKNFNQHSPELRIGLRY